MKYGYLFTGLILFLFAGCDDITTQESDDPVSILLFEAEPAFIEFPAETPEMDTTITVSLNLELREETSTEILYALVKKREVQFESILIPSSPRIYQAEFDLNLNTAFSDQYTIHVYTPGASDSDFAEASLRIISHLGIPPEILDAFNTELVQIPQSNTRERVDFYAKATHPSGQELIQKVEFLLVDQTGNEIGRFELFDDGVFDEPSGLIDEVAGDSLYSRALFIDHSNNPDKYEVLYYAISTNDVSSDTVRTTLQIVE